MQKILLYLLFIYPFIPSLNAEETRIHIITEEWPPYNYIEDNEMKGLSVELVNEIMIKLGRDYSIEFYPSMRTKMKLNTEKKVVMISLFRTPAREHRYKWAGPLVKGSIYFYQSSESTLQVETMDDAKLVDSICCRSAGLIYNKLTEQGFQNLDNAASSSIQVYKMLIAGRGDLGISDTELGVIYNLKKMGYPTDILKQTNVKVFEEDLYIAFSKDISDLVVADWQEALDEIKKSGRYSEIYKNYVQ